MKLDYQKERIVFFHPQNNYTGSTRVLANIIEETFPNISVTVICEDDHHKGFLSNKNNIKILPIRSLKFRKRKIKGLTYLSYLIYGSYLAFRSRKSFSIFYINTLVPFYASLIGILYRKKIVYHVHEKYVKTGMIGKIEEFVFNRSKAHRIFVSKYTKNKYPHSQKCTEEIKYNFLPKSYIKGIEPQPIEKRIRNRILMVSSLSPIKGIDMFVEIAKIMRDYTFTLILSSDEVSIRNYFKSDLPSNLNILPSQADIRNILKNSDLILNLSNPKLCVETFGMTILEAMPFAIPAVVPNVGGPLELVEDGYNGRVVDTSSKEEIIAGIKSILKDEEKYYIYCKNTIAKYEKEFKL